MIYKLLTCLSLIFLPAIYLSAQQGNFKVLDYNTLHGFEGDASKKEKFVQWVQKINPDIIAYEEMIDFPAAELDAFAKKFGHSYSVIMSREKGIDVTHPLALSSRYPIEDVKMVLDSMWHGYLYARIQGVHVFVVHLAPFTLQDRRKDLAQLLAHAATLPPNDKILITGDFNALSETDSSAYNRQHLLETMQKTEGRLEPKSGTPIVKNRIIYRNNLDGNQIDYSVMRLIRDAGFTDAFYALHKTFKNSAPSKSHETKNSKKRRIDYIWLNPALAKALVAADIIHDDTTAVLSDHYPVFVQLNLNK